MEFAVVEDEAELLPCQFRFHFAQADRGHVAGDSMRKLLRDHTHAGHQFQQRQCLFAFLDLDVVRTAPRDDPDAIFPPGIYLCSPLRRFMAFSAQNTLLKSARVTMTGLLSCRLMKFVSVA